MARSIAPTHWVDYESEHLTFRSLWHAARVLREAGEKNDSQGFWSLMAATLMTYTAYEGFTNDLLERLYPDVAKAERTFFSSGRYRGTLGKTQFLADRLGIVLARTSRPFTTVAELHRWRNDLVHPRTVRRRGTTTADSYAKNPRRAAPVGFAKLQRPAFVLRCFQDVEVLGNTLLSAAGQAHWTTVCDLGSSAFSGVFGSGSASLKIQT
jgi:hypothetical protein